MTEEEAINILKDFIKYYERLSENEAFTEQDRNNVIRRKQAIETILNLVKKQQEELEKKNKIIDLMAGYLFYKCNDLYCYTPEEIKQYFENKVEGSK